MSANATPEARGVDSFDTPLMDRINLYFRLRRYIKMLARRWFILLLTVAVGVGMAAHRAYSMPKIYRAISKIGIASRVVTPFDNKAAVLVDINSFYDTHLQYLQSTKVRERVLAKIRADERLAGMSGPASASATKGLGFFLITVDATNFLFAQQYALHWAREFMSFKEELTASTVDLSLAETQREIERYERKLEKARQDLLAFQVKHNIASVKETADAAQQRLDKLLDEMTAVQTLRQRLENKSSRDLLKGGMVETRRLPERSSSDTSNPAPQTGDTLERLLSESKYAELEFRLLSKEDEVKKYSATLKPRHPFMQNLLAEVDKLKREMQYQLDLIEDKRLARIESLKRDEESYKPLIEDLRKQVFESRNIQNQFDRLKSDETDIKNELESLRRKARALEASNTRGDKELAILEEGIGSPVPISPNRQKIILVGLLLGLAAGCGIIYLLDKLDDRLELAEDIEAELGLPILGQVPLLGSRQAKPRILITQMEEHSMFAESIRVVRSAIMLGVESPEKQVQIITSAVPGDGKTTFSVNYAITLALAGNRVLLVDADLRRGNVNGFFNLEREQGLAEILGGEVHWLDVVKDTSVAQLKLITTGKLPGNPGELLIGPITAQFIREARQQYDFVVFDCPPLTAIDDAFALAGHADGLLFVVRAGKTSMRFARNALNAVQQRGGRIFGVVLNGITADNPYYYYNYYYHGYYRSRERKSSKESQAADVKPGKVMPPPRKTAAKPGTGVPVEETKEN
ncbi:polysaccharide biosynthesis tyrosine autokinase [Fontisphaera persica]|uniref:polysaccharide biosynthesis tyrosine autokinase n=1 Tax=Fontisphaera persica TaxID=2974023 RepID=UPI0024BF1FEE|nr:polysaccharide biosynthesis tyrosine autokinase [Fontisphaera persica]WCJ59053.1 polysaccharide biosynthesis tyrosine autokinase [Fontisphaera persica]